MYEMLVGLQVTDEETYAQYRAAMMPILTSYGGGFSSDFKVSAVLLPRTHADINRVFTIHFPDEKTKDAFFSDADYLKAKALYFEGSVAGTTILSSYQRESEITPQQ